MNNMKIRVFKKCFLFVVGMLIFVPVEKLYGIKKPDQEKSLEVFFSWYIDNYYKKGVTFEPVKKKILGLLASSAKKPNESRRKDIMEPYNKVVGEVKIADAEKVYEISEKNRKDYKKIVLGIPFAEDEKLKESLKKVGIKVVKVVTKVFEDTFEKKELSEKASKMGSINTAVLQAEVPGQKKSLEELFTEYIDNYYKKGVTFEPVKKKILDLLASSAKKPNESRRKDIMEPYNKVVGEVKIADAEKVYEISEKNRKDYKKIVLGIPFAEDKDLRFR